MKRKIILGAISIAFVTGILITLTPGELFGQRRVVVRPVRRVRHPVRTTRLVVRAGHPIRRVWPTSVVVRSRGRVVVGKSPLVFLPAFTWTRTVAVLPVGDRLVWQDSEEIDEDDGWVDANFGVDSEGNALFLNIGGRAKLNFAEVTFANGNVQVVDFNEQTHDAGIYKLLDFADGRRVNAVRILAKSESDETKLAVYLSK